MGDADKHSFFNNGLLVFYGLVLLLVLARLLPHPPNFTPVGAIGLFIGAYSRDRWQWFLPLIALFLSDYFIGIYSFTSMLFVYLGIFASSVLGYYLLHKQIKILHLISATFASALVFFLLSNLGVWLSATLYPMTFSGLLACYVAAIPFFGNTLASYLIFSLLAFGGYESFRMLFSKINNSSVS